jgi:hypothetical protein
MRTITIKTKIDTLTLAAVCRSLTLLLAAVSIAILYLQKADADRGELQRIKKEKRRSRLVCT